MNAKNIDQDLPIIAIVGRPNVGKSTLFNRLTSSRLAIVDDTPGVTRDWRQGKAKLGHLEFYIRDTAGIEERAQNSLAERLLQQTEQALADCKAILFVVDGREGVTPIDKGIARKLRKTGLPVIVLVNKSETKDAYAGANEAAQLGFGVPIPISAAHGEGMSDILDSLRPYAERPEKPQVEVRVGDDEKEYDYKDKPLKICVIGRPNVGKSTLVNTLIGEDRLLTGPEAGLTRESISISKQWNGRDVVLVDTAGLRKKARIEEKLEKLSVANTLATLRYTELAIVVIDVEQPFEKQDLQLVDLVVQEGRAVVIAINKWDLVKNPPAKRKELQEMCDRLLPQIKGVPLITISATHAKGLEYLYEAVTQVEAAWNTRISTAKLNDWLRDKILQNPPPAVGGRRLKIKYATQAKSRPPTFIGFTTRAEDFPESYLRFLTNGLRDEFKLYGVPIRFQLRERKNPYENKKKEWD